MNLKNLLFKYFYYWYSFDVNIFIRQHSVLFGEVKTAKSLSTNSSHTTTQFFSINDEYFLKVIKGYDKSFEINKILSEHDLPVPKLKSLIQYKGYTVLIYQYYVASTFNAFSQFSDFFLNSFIANIAKIDYFSLTLSEKEFKSIHEATKKNIIWFKKKKHVILEMEKILNCKFENLDFFYAHEDIAINKYVSLEKILPRVITHNDLRAMNVLIENDDLIIIDWDNVSFSLIGINLRRLAILNSFENLIEQYIQSINKGSFVLQADNILFVACMVDIYWALELGAKTKKIKLIEYGLNLFKKKLVRWF